MFGTGCNDWSVAGITLVDPVNGERYLVARDPGGATAGCDPRPRRHSYRGSAHRFRSPEDVRLEAVGYGEARPRVPDVVDGGSSEENLAQNRWVEITDDLRDWSVGVAW